MNEKYKARIQAAINNAEEFIARAKLTIKAQNSWEDQPQSKNAAMKRTSMDLTKSLALVRKGPYFDQPFPPSSDAENPPVLK